MRSFSLYRKSHWGFHCLEQVGTSQCCPTLNFTLLFAGRRQVLNRFLRRRTCRKLSTSHPTIPGNPISQAYATTTTIFREISYPLPLHFSHPWTSWLTLPPLGRSLAILTYWVIITLFLTTGSIIHDAYYYERVAFRAAWVSITQVPLIYLLAGKVNVLGMLFGSSYIDLNWIHRWVSRTLFVTVTIHGGFFIKEWVRADFFQLELEMMPMVKWGLVAWAVLAWTMISSLLPLRRWCYEFFVLQHIASGVVYLWLIYKHVPAHARYNIWMAIAFLVSGRLLRGCMFLFRNFSKSGIGHTAELQALPGGITAVTIHDIDFSWKAGQHILLRVPALGPFESHPFTISNLPHQNPSNRNSNKIQLLVRARSGFTRRLHHRATSSSSQATKMRAFINAPFGNLPAWNTFETLVLISASTGASFTLSILESVLRDPCCVSRIECVLLVRDGSQIEGYLEMIRAAAGHPRAAELSLRIEIAVTGGEVVDGEDGAASETTTCSSIDEKSPEADHHRSRSQHPLSPPVPVPAPINEKADIEAAALSLSISSSSSSKPTTNRLRYTYHRPHLSSVIRQPIEASSGETLVTVCGGLSLTSEVRNIVARLSDERGVHKGSGAQGIRLHVEGYGS